jgi:hypothetical protein
MNGPSPGWRGTNGNSRREAHMGWSFKQDRRLIEIARATNDFERAARFIDNQKGV